MGEAAKQFEELPIEISSVTPEMLDHVWSSQIEMIERGLRHGQGNDVTSDDMLAGILLGRWLMWVIHRGTDIIAIVVLSVITTPRKKKLFVELIAGRDLPSWYVQLHDLLIDFKEVIGADCIEASCRPGLAKYLSEMGWSKKATIMELV